MIDIEERILWLTAKRIRGGTLYEMKAYIGDEIVVTTLATDTRGQYKKCSCSCGRTYFAPCSHVMTLALCVAEKGIEYPYTYMAENGDREGQFVKAFHEKERMKEAVACPEQWMSSLVKKNTKKVAGTLQNEKAHLSPFIDTRCSVSRQHVVLRYRIGTEKEYIIKDLTEKLLDALISESFVEFGKNLKMTMKYSAFNDQAKRQIEFLRTYRSNIENDKFYVTSRNIDSFFELYKDEGGITDMAFEEKDFGLTVTWKKVSDYYFLDFREKGVTESKKPRGAAYMDPYLIRKSMPPHVMTENRMYDIQTYEKKLYYMDITQEEYEFYTGIYFNRMYFTKERLAEVLSIFKGKLPSITIPEDLIEDVTAVEPVKPRLDCDIDEFMNLLLRVQYKETYPNFYILSLLGRLSAGNVPEAKDEKLALENEKSSIDYEKTFRVEKKNDVVNFVESVLPTLGEVGNVYLSESLKHFNIPRKVDLTVGVRVKHDLMALSFNSSELSSNEIYEILSHYRKKKKYFRMRSGDIILIDQEQMEDLDGFVRDMGIDDRELKKGKAQVGTFRRYQLADETRVPVERGEKFERILTDEEPIPLAKRFNSLLRDYQKEGTQFMLRLRRMGLNGILADDMGLGKTLQVIALLESLEGQRTTPCLIVTPASLLLNWENEFKKFHSPLKIVSVNGNKEERKNQILTIQDQVVITSYDYLKRDKEFYDHLTFDTMVIDEAQYIKNYKTQAAQSVKYIKAQHRLALTGTPIENSLAEIWSIFDFLMPGYLFKYGYFARNFEKPIVLSDDKEVTRRLKKMVEPFILRRLKKNVLKELPDKIEETYMVNLSQEEKNLYAANLAAMHEQMEAGEDNKIAILAMLTKLRQLCIDARLVYSNVYEPGSKIKMAVEMIQKAVLNHEKVLLFSSFTSVLDILAQECSRLGITYFMLTGATGKTQRNDYVEAFQTGDVPLFLISLKAGGTGLNLTEASLVIHVDPWWNLSAQNQATDRAHRIGQEKKVQVISLIAKGTVEEKIQVMQESKKALSDTFVENSTGSFAKLSSEELKDLFEM